MIAFEVLLKGKRVCVAGAEDLAVLTTHVTASGKLGTKTIPARNPWRRTAALVLRLNPARRFGRAVHAPPCVSEEVAHLRRYYRLVFSGKADMLAQKQVV